ncbi:hypothetical protein N7448_002035 [Penicillium atrosanguineum]|uniref:DDE-1 domain-containing protein n=1 Tax=Penicillium atrosanguineum TaxID=1132637 RepID=A0A9W9HDA2_9EURO|nr:hypothetical protein N7448_002035 [Penicillium atrosanguineum]KAJ5311078.1 hypothetical protein N7476_006938 [Penicillium atrosanguineum]
MFLTTGYVPVFSADQLVQALFDLIKLPLFCGHRSLIRFIYSGPQVILPQLQTSLLFAVPRASCPNQEIKIGFGAFYDAYRNPYHSLTKQNSDEYYFSTTIRGHLNDSFVLKLLKLFHEHTKDRTKRGQKRILLNGYLSHKTIELPTFCDKRNDIPIYFPSHITHLL